MSSARRFAPTLAPRQVFLGRVFRGGIVSCILIAVMLTIGTLGYRVLVPGIAWIDAFRESAMLMSGMGPVFSDSVQLSTAAKFFDSVYALVCGVALLGATGVLFAPIWHRFIHRFHIEDAAERS